MSESCQQCGAETLISRYKSSSGYVYRAIVCKNCYNSTGGCTCEPIKFIWRINVISTGEKREIGWAKNGSLVPNTLEITSSDADIMNRLRKIYEEFTTCGLPIEITYCKISDGIMKYNGE